MTADLSQAEARRLALNAQGLAGQRPAATRLDDIRAVIRRLGLVQLDFVNLLLPAHYLVFYSRLGAYDRAWFDELVYQRREFTEHWAHEASVIPMDVWPLLAYRRANHRIWPFGFETFLAENPAYTQRILDELRQRGALTPADLPHDHDHPRKLAGTWVGTVPRAVLEAHFGNGRVSIANRLPNFTRVYDLAERVIPTKILLQRVDEDEARRRLLLSAARAHGVATAGDLADYYRMLVQDARPRLAELVDAGLLRTVRVDNWREPAYLDPAAVIPQEALSSTLLCPFDPLIWTRARTQRLFGFEYRFEIFVPAEKRQWGAYVLPFLHGDRLTARVDVKAERTEGRLAVLGSFLEDGADAGGTAAALARALKDLSAWLGLGTVRVSRRGNLARALGAAVRG